MRLLLLFIGWFLPTSLAFTLDGWTRFQPRGNYDRLSFYSTTSDQEVLKDETKFFQRNIEFAAATPPFVDTGADTTVDTNTNVHHRFDRVVGPKHALIYDTTLRGMFHFFLFV